MSSRTLDAPAGYVPKNLFWESSPSMITSSAPRLRSKSALHSLLVVDITVAPIALIEICPVRNVIARFGNEWALLVILVISENDPIRYNELSRKIPDISSRVLSSTLRVLADDGLIERKVYQEVPPRVEYSLTDTGRSLVPIIIRMTDWAQANLKTILEHRSGKQQ